MSVDLTHSDPVWATRAASCLFRSLTSGAGWARSPLSIGRVTLREQRRL